MSLVLLVRYCGWLCRTLPFEMAVHENTDSENCHGNQKHHDQKHHHDDNEFSCRKSKHYNVTIQ